MPLVERGRVVEDRYLRVADDAPLPDDQPAIVSAARFLAEAETLARHAAPLGVIWPNDRPVAELAPHLSRLALVGLVFPVFRDGRAYSQARLLRERHGFRGELRATGNVLRDQFLFMLRAGFDSFEVTKEADAAAFAESVARYDVFYQPTADGRETARRARHSHDQSGRLRENERVESLTPDDTDGRTGS
jgi:uncharacterized protein (DUF934 family)